MVNAEKSGHYEGTMGVQDSPHTSSFAGDDESVYTLQTIQYGNPVRRFIDSFKPVDLDSEGIDTTDMTPLEKSVIATARHPLARRLKNRHLQMIAIGGSIGTGLFVGSGYALSQGGPGAQLIGYFIVGYALLCVVNALGEMSVQFPVSGSFNAYFSRFVDPAWGFTLGILYACSWLISFPSELVAVSMTIGYWNKDIDPAAWVAIFWVAVVVISLFGIRGYGEVEFFLSILKILAVVGFIICGICIAAGVGDQGYLGTKYWHDPGSFNQGFKGVASVFISAAFSFGGIELVALAAAETENPRKSLPRATKAVFWRVALFYIATSVVVGCLVPYTNEALLGSDDPTQDIASSPFVIAIELAGIKVLPHIMNAVVVIVCLSLGISCVYGCSRTLASLAVQGLLPSCFAYIDRAGRPLISLIACAIFALLGFLADYSNQSDVFTWFFSVCSLSSFFTWSAILFTHLRWRWALTAQGRSLDEVIWPSPMGVWGDYSGIIVFLFIIACELYISIKPTWLDGGSDAETFFQNCLSLPLMIVMYVAYKTFTKTWKQLLVPLEEIDLDTGRREIDLEELKQSLADEREAAKHAPFYIKVYHFFC